MGVIIDIRDGLILGRKDKTDAVSFFVSEKTGIETASFNVGVREYDDSYENNTRYNNFYITVPPEMVDRVKKLKLRKNSLVHILGTLDFGKEVLAEKRQQGDPESKNYGKSRSVTGLKVRLISIDYAGASSAAKTDDNQNNNHEQHNEESVKNAHEENNDTTVNTAASEVTSKKSIEESMNIPSIDLDEDDIFSRREKRKFF